MANIIDLSQFRDNAEQTKPNIISLQGFAKTPSLSETYAHDSVADKAAFAARLRSMVSALVAVRSLA